MKTKIRNSISGLLFIPLLLTCFVLLPRAQAETQAQAVTPQLALPGFNTADGLNALDSLTTGTFNSAFGFNTLTVNTTGSHNTALGGQALLNNNGDFNTAVGENALVHNTSGAQNMALGQGALATNTTGDNNTAMGFQALNVNNADDNVAVGFQALRANSGGAQNVAVGFQALLSNDIGIFNTAVGTGALALSKNGGLFLGGSVNTAVGFAALGNNTSGAFNTAIGFNAGANITTASNVIAIGPSIGQNVPDSCYIANIHGEPVNGASDLTVIVDANGKLGTNTSSQRFKKDIRPMDQASEAILSLKPVTFHYKSDSLGVFPRFGLIAEDVAKVNPDLIVRDRDGQILSVRYDAVNAMLLNEFLKEHRRVEELKNDFQTTVARQQTEIQALTAQLKEQAAQIQKVSAQLEVSKPAPRTVANK